MLVQRLFFGALLIAALLGLLYVDSRLGVWFAREAGPYDPSGALVTAVLAALLWMGSRELDGLMRAGGYAPLRTWPALMIVLLAATPFLALTRIMPTTYEPPPVANLTLALLTAATFGSFFLVGCRRQSDGAIANVALTLFAILYLGLLGQFIARLSLAGGVPMVLYYVAVVKCCDIGAYFTGLAVGRHKLIPWLSPKKTWEGLAGGIGASVLVAIFLPRLLAPQSIFGEAASLPAAAPAALFGLVMAVVGQAGDLFESLLKRSAEAKDSAAAVPAFGGILDIIDSILLTAPVAYWLLT